MQSFASIDLLSLSILLTHYQHLLSTEKFDSSETSPKGSSVVLLLRSRRRFVRRAAAVTGGRQGISLYCKPFALPRFAKNRCDWFGKNR